MAAQNQRILAARTQIATCGSKAIETLHLDRLHQPDQARALRTLRNMLFQGRGMVVISGAGISAASGIPPFRCDKGLLREKFGKFSGRELLTRSMHLNPAAHREFNEFVSRMSTLCGQKAPSRFHKMLDHMAARGQIKRCYTQNIDGLESRLRFLSPADELVPGQNGLWPITVQLHGSLLQSTCEVCNTIQPLIPDDYANGEGPQCGTCSDREEERRVEGKRCGGIKHSVMRPRISLYGEPAYDDEEIAKVMDEDVTTLSGPVIVAGTSMQIPGLSQFVRDLARAAKERRHALIWINYAEPPDIEGRWDLAVKGNCETLAQLTGMGIGEYWAKSGEAT